MHATHVYGNYLVHGLDFAAVRLFQFHILRAVESEVINTDSGGSLPDADPWDEARLDEWLRARAAPGRLLTRRSTSSRCWRATSASSYTSATWWWQKYRDTRWRWWSWYRFVRTLFLAVIFHTRLLSIIVICLFNLWFLLRYIPICSAKNLLTGWYLEQIKLCTCFW